jgi:hypothetical protein
MRARPDLRKKERYSRRLFNPRSEKRYLKQGAVAVLSGIDHGISRSPVRLNNRRTCYEKIASRRGDDRHIVYTGRCRPFIAKSFGRSQRQNCCSPAGF